MGPSLVTNSGGHRLHPKDHPGYLCILLGEVVRLLEAVQSSGGQSLLLQEMLQKQDELVWEELRAKAKSLWKD